MPTLPAVASSMEAGATATPPPSPSPTDSPAEVTAALAKKRPTNLNTPYPSTRLERCNTGSLRPEYLNQKPDIPTPHRPLRRRNSVTNDRRPLLSPSSSSKPPLSPSLYGPPESAPLPDSPTSPYVINHKRRGPRLVKSYSLSDGKVDEVDARLYNAHLRRISRESREDRSDDELESGSKGDHGAKKDGSSVDGDLVRANVELRILTGSASFREDGESEDFYDPQDSMSYMSFTDGEDYGGDQTARMYTPMAAAEFYDAWEEQSSENGRQTRRSLFNAEIDLREMRLNMLMEMEKRKQAEEALNTMRSQWQTLREKLATVGLTLPAEIPGSSSEDTKSDATNPVEDICQQVYVTRIVSESIGKAAARTEAESEIKAQLEAKNFEIARLSDRLHYYETMNWEMSQRNQEAIEITRRERQKKRMTQELIWGSIGAAITLGSAALVWSFVPGWKGSDASKPETKSK